MSVLLNDQISAALHCHKIEADVCVTKVPAIQAQDPSQSPGPMLKRVLHSQCWGGRARESGAHWSAVQLNPRAAGSMKDLSQTKRWGAELPSKYTCVCTHIHTHKQYHRYTKCLN